MIGKRVRELRIEKEMSQQELGLAIGVTKVSICGYENGTRIPNLEKLIKLADVLETTTDYLLGREIPITNEENKTYIGSISYEDVCFISELRHYSNLYNKLLKDVKRSASIINKRLIK
ncbi:MAG: helix-turn-helix transcriptional regulator [Bacilli bacterium]|nr:helix-turn-helix transcriptional regulator [Bacilli bacterium]